MPIKSSMPNWALRFSALFIAAGVMLMTGCATVALPETKPVTEGIFTEPPSKSPATKVPGGPDVSLGVILSQNARANIAYLLKYQDLANSGFGNPILLQSLKDAYSASADPAFLTHGISASLKRHFGSVIVYEDIDSARAAQPDVVAIIDLQHVLKQAGNSDITARVAAHFYDSQFRRIGASTGMGKGRTGTFGMNTKGAGGLVDEMYQQQHMPRVRALQQFDQSLQTLIARRVDLATTAPGPQYDQCMERVLKISNPDLRQKAMAACDDIGG